MKIFDSNFSNLNNSGNLRLDVKFNFFVNVKHFLAWKVSKSLTLNTVLTIIKSPAVKKGELDNELHLIDLENIERKANCLKDVTLVSEIGSDKNFISRGDLVIPKLEPHKGQFFLNIDHREYLATTELIEYSVNQNFFNPTFLYYTLVTENFLSTLACLESGKTHKRVNPDELLRIKIPHIPKAIQEETVVSIKNFENEIKKLKSLIKPDTEIINDVFMRRFGWDITKFNELRSIRIMNCNFYQFSKNSDSRFSFKFHNKAGEFVWQTLKSHSSKYIKNFLAEDITLGKSISPNDYDENGEQYYVSMADIKNWRFETDEAKTISQSYYDTNPEKKIAINDIILARSGEGTIGKVAIIDNEENEGIYADFTMRIRLKNFNPVFAYYYFRTHFFQYLIYTHKKGLGNNTNIFPGQLREFPMLSPPLSVQDEIVNQIDTMISEQQKIELKINQKKKEINNLLINAISTGDLKG
jgi:type I restriction enzyme, S subunit